MMVTSARAHGGVDCQCFDATWLAAGRAEEDGEGKHVAKVDAPKNHGRPHTLKMVWQDPR